MIALEVTYPAGSYSVEFDRRIERLVGRNRDGSGMGFGCRDMSFYYKKKSAANAAAKKLAKLKTDDGEPVETQVYDF